MIILLNNQFFYLNYICQKEISKFVNLDKIGNEFINARNNLKTQSKMNDIIEDKLKPEKENLEKAIKIYNDKASKVMESSEVKELQKSFQKHSKDAQNNLIKAQKEFVKLSDEIKTKTWSDEKKIKK